MTESESPDNLTELGFETSKDHPGIVIRLATDRGQTMRVSLNPKQASDLVSKTIYAAWVLGQENPDLKALLPDQVLTTKIDRIEAKFDSSTQDVLLRLSAGFVGVVVGSEIGALKGLTDWLNEQFVAASTSAVKH